MKYIYSVSLNYILAAFILGSTAAQAANDAATFTHVPASSHKVQVPYVSTTYPSEAAINRLTNMSSCPSTIICPDINGNYPSGGSSSTCPDTCTVTRSPSNSYIASNPTTTVKTATCPTGYAKVGNFNVDDEIDYQTQGGYDTVTNPSSKSVFQTYYGNSGRGYAYQLNGSYITSTSSCVGLDGTISDGGFSLTNYTDKNGVSRSLTYRNGTYRAVTSVTAECYAYNCGTKYGESSISGQTTWDDSHVYSEQACADEIGWGPVNRGKKYRLGMQQIKLLSPAGNYSTGEKVPSSVICSRVKIGWSSAN